MGTARGLARVRREALAACMTCPLCRGLLREATAITLCLHTCECLLLSLPPSLATLAVSVPFVRFKSLSAPVSARARAARPRVGARLLAFASFVLVSDSSCSLVQMPPAIGLVSDASSLIRGGWRTRCLSRGLWAWLSSRVLRGCPWWPQATSRRAFAFASPWPALLLETTSSAGVGVSCPAPTGMVLPTSPCI